MTTLQIANRILTSEQIIPLLASYRIIPQLLCESIIDRAIAAIDCTPEETAEALQKFDSHWGLSSETEREAWRNQYGLSQAQLENLATRKLRVAKFKEATWGSQLNCYFLQRKSQLDQVIYSLIRTQNAGIANELYFRIKEEEQSFTELAGKYSEGPEALTGGLMGAVELGTLHPTLAYLLYANELQVGVVQPPIRLGEWHLIIRLEKFIPAQLNEFMRQRLLQEKFQAWFQEQVNQLSPHDKIWMGATANQQVDSGEHLAAVS